MNPLNTTHKATRRKKRRWSPEAKLEVEKAKRRELERLVNRLDDEVFDLKAMLRDRSKDRIWWEDGELHFSHLCLGQETTTPLRWWSVSKMGHISPSIACLVCNAHIWAYLGDSDEATLHYIESKPKHRKGGRFL